MSSIEYGNSVDVWWWRWRTERSDQEYAADYRGKRDPIRSQLTLDALYPAAVAVITTAYGAAYVVNGKTLAMQVFDDVDSACMAAIMGLVP